MIFSREFIEQVKKNTDIVDLVSEFTELRKAGNDIWKAKCPNEEFHEGGDDSDPSLVVYPNHGSFYCFGCCAGSKKAGYAGSDSVAFVQWIKGITFEEAVQWLAERAGMDVEGHFDPYYEEKKRLFDMTRAQVQIYHEALLRDGDMLQYLYDRGVTDDSIELWQLGKVPDDTQFPQIKRRLAFPISNSMSRVAGFGFRSMDGSKPKYINNPESMIWVKGSNLYGYDIVKKKRKDSIILVEGFMDVILLHQCGIDTAVATMGTSLTDSQVGLISRLTKEVTVFIDGDTPGEEAASRHIRKLRGAGFRVYVVPTPTGNDPADLAQRLGSQMGSYIEANRVLWADFEIAKITTKFYSDWNRLKMDALDKLQPIFNEMNATEQGIYLNMIRDLLEVRPWYERNKDRMAQGIRDAAGSSSVL